MKAAVFDEYGPPEVLHLTELDKPTPKENGVVVKVKATTVSPIDLHCRSGNPFLARLFARGVFKPRLKILGFDLAGDIESTGRNVKGLKKGNPVYGFIPMGESGANAEFVSIPEKNLMIKPDLLSYEEAAAVPTAARIALWFLKQGGIEKAQKILINGASGGLGTFAVQIAKSYGIKVTAVCSTVNIEMMRYLGADEIIDYTKKDFTVTENKFDIIFDAAGKTTFADCRTSLTLNGRYVSTAVTSQSILDMLITSIIGKKKAISKIAKPGVEDFNFINNLVMGMKIKPVIDKIFPFEKIVDAHRYAEKGHAKGKVIVKLID